MQETLTYLQMTSPDQLRPAQPVRGLDIEPAEPGSPLIRRLQERIATPHHWTRLTWSDLQWNQWLASPWRSHWLFRRNASVVGLLELEDQPDGDVEISAFGLTGEHIGQGLGGHALTLSTRTAWAPGRPHSHRVRRVWLYTSTLDHPHALPNYHSRGFTPYLTVVRERADLGAHVARQQGFPT